MKTTNKLALALLADLCDISCNINTFDKSGAKAATTMKTYAFPTPSLTYWSWGRNTA